eukprot:scaffold133033_cov15-Tisochrysis_lutea.AAC.2
MQIALEAAAITSVASKSWRASNSVHCPRPKIFYGCLSQVIASIKDNIRESELVDYLESVFYHVPVSSVTKAG